MTTDRTTKTLLFLIAVGLWGLLLRSFFTPERTDAQALITPVRIVAVDGAVPVAVQRSAALEIKAAPGSVIPVEVRK